MIKIKYINDSKVEGSIVDYKVEIGDEATTTTAVEAFSRVLLASGYSNESIRNAFDNMAYELQESIKASYKIMTERIGDGSSN